MTDQPITATTKQCTTCDIGVRYTIAQLAKRRGYILNDGQVNVVVRSLAVPLYDVIKKIIPTITNPEINYLRRRAVEEYGPPPIDLLTRYTYET